MKKTFSLVGEKYSLLNMILKVAYVIVSQNYWYYFTAICFSTLRKGQKGKNPFHPMNNFIIVRGFYLAKSCLIKNINESNLSTLHKL